MKARAFIFTVMAASIIGATSISAEDAEPTVTEVTTATESILGDVNSDSIVNVRDCAFIARKLAENKADELSPETADYNKDTLVNVRDAASIARDLNLNFTNSKPNKSDYDTSTIEGMKKYVNDTISRIALEKYSVAEILPDDNVESVTWYDPVRYIGNADYFKQYTSADIYGIGGIMPMSYVTTAEDVIKGLEENLVAISQREQPDGTSTDMSRKRLRIKWVALDEGGNYEIYLCYGGNY